LPRAPGEGAERLGDLQVLAARTRTRSKLSGRFEQRAEARLAASEIVLAFSACGQLVDRRRHHPSGQAHPHPPIARASCHRRGGQRSSGSRKPNSFILFCRDFRLIFSLRAAWVTFPPVSSSARTISPRSS